MEIKDMNLSTHFTLRELERSSTAARLEIDNTASQKVIDNAKRLAILLLEPIREHFGISFSPNSWYRSESLEKVITKTGYTKWCRRHDKKLNELSWNEYFARKSHPNGQAVDIEIVGVDNDELFRWIKEDSGLEYDQLIREFAKEGDPQSGWVHISYNRMHNRMQDFCIG